MTTYQVISLLMTPVGALVIAAWAYWIATRPEKPEPRQPAE